MLSIGELLNICKVSAKTLRYYTDIGLLRPGKVNPEKGYRYYDIKQLRNTEKLLSKAATQNTSGSGYSINLSLLTARRSNLDT